MTTPSLPPSLRRFSAILLACVFGYVFLTAAYHAVYADQIFPGIKLAGQTIGGADQVTFDTHIAQIASQNADDIMRRIEWRVGDKTLRLPTSYLTAGTQMTYEQAVRFGKNPLSPWFYAPFALRIGTTDLATLQTHLNEEALEQAIEDAARPFEEPSKPAELQFSFEGASSSVTILPEHIGVRVARDRAISDAKKALPQAMAGQHVTITLPFTKDTEPTITSADLEPALPTIREWLSRGPVTLTGGKKPITIPPAVIASWITVQPDTAGASASIDRERAATSLNSLTADMRIDAKPGTLSIQDNKLVAFTAPIDGYGLNIEKTLVAFQALLDQAGSSTFRGAYENLPGRIEGPDAEKYGLRDWLGNGTSNFAGSPTNRRKNIALGAEKVHGSLVAPGEEFSLLKTLGEIDGEHGWLPELVIKGNKTTPEFGGGLCQIGTTVFRGSTNIGMPITARQNHSYRVSYYEPAGTDATIYDPAPDFKFKNDTENWILITKDLRANDVTFHFWGTKDGRNVVKTTPKVTNIVAPPPMKLIETTELKPGEKKCTEKEHAGATASFDYSVTYANGEEKKVTFTSHYRPWQAVCLVGVAKTTAPLPAGSLPDETGLNNPG